MNPTLGSENKYGSLIRKVKLHEFVEELKKAKPEISIDLNDLFVEGCPVERVLHLSQELCSTAMLFGYEVISIDEKRITLRYAISE